MKRRKRRWRDAGKALLRAGGVALIISLGCDDPTPPYPPHEWREAAPFPDNVERVGRAAEAADGNVYVAASCRDEEMNYRPVVYRYAAGEIVEAYLSPYKGGGFDEVACAYGRVWAAGAKKPDNNESYEPYLVRYDGARWEEIPVPETVASLSLGGVYPINADAWWACAYDGVYTCRAGEWEKRFSFSERDRYDFAVTPGGRAAVYKCTYYSDPEVLVSDDGGATWARERPRLDNKHFTYHSNQPAGFTSRGEGFCWAVRLRLVDPEQRWEAHYVAVITRDDAPAGLGTYETILLAPRGPYLTNIHDLAFRDELNGYAVGTFTSLAYRDGEWLFQSLPESWHPHFEHVTAGYSSFWAVASRYGGGSVKLYRAP